MKTTKAFRIQILIAVIVFICGVSLISLLYITLNKPVQYITPGVIVTSPSPVATPVQSARSRTMPMSRPIHQTSHTSTLPHSNWRSTSSAPAMHVYRTSNAQMNSYGGGAGGMGMTGSSTNASSSRGITASNSSVAMPATNFLALASTRQMAMPEAADAPAMARLASSPNRAPGPPTTGGEGADPDHQLIEQPIGEPWVMALLALLYAFGRFIMEKKQKRTA